MDKKKTTKNSKVVEKYNIKNALFSTFVTQTSERPWYCDLNILSYEHSWYDSWLTPRQNCKTTLYPTPQTAVFLPGG